MNIEPLETLKKKQPIAVTMQSVVKLYKNTVTTVFSLFEVP